MWFKFHQSQGKRCHRAWGSFGSGLAACIHGFSMCGSDWEVENGAHQHKLLLVLHPGQRVATGMHVTLFPLCWETCSIGAAWEGIHLSVWCQLYRTASRQWEICGVHDTAGSYVPRVGLTEDTGSWLTSHIVPVHSATPSARLGLHSKKRPSDKPGIKCRMKPTPTFAL